MASDAKVDNSEKSHISNGKNNAFGDAGVGTKSIEGPAASKTKRNFSETIHHIWNNITLEPLVVCFVMPSMLLMLGSSNLNLEKACRVNLGYTQTVCDALTRRETANYTL